MKTEALFSSKDKSEKFKCHLLQFLFGTLRVNSEIEQSVARRIDFVCILHTKSNLLATTCSCFKLCFFLIMQYIVKIVAQIFILQYNMNLTDIAIHR